MTPSPPGRTWFALACAGMALAIMAFGWIIGWGGLPDMIGDARFALARRPASGQVVLVDIDEKSIAAIGVWPWPRTVHAGIVDRLHASGASDIAFDVDFSSRSSEAADASFEAALQRAEGKVILAAERQRLSAASTDLELIVPLPRFAGNAWLALADVMVDRDGLIRTIPGGIRHGDETIPSLAAALSAIRAGAAPDVRIDYGIDASGIDHISVSDLLAGKVDATRIAGRKIIVGATSVALRDFFSVPRYGVIQGSLVHALAAETLLQNRALVRESAATRLAGSAMLMLAVFFILLLAPAVPAVALAAGLALALETLATGVQRMQPLSLDTADWQMVLLGTVLAIICREIWERGTLWKIARDERRATQAILDRVFEDNFSAILVADGAGHIRAASSEALRHFGPGALATIHGNPAEALLSNPLNALFAVDDQQGSSADTGLIELETATNGRRIFDYTRSASVFSGKLASDPARLAICVTLQDVTERRQAEKRIATLARTDGLTQLPNRNSFMEAMAVRAANSDTHLLMIDLDGFKAINDAMGHAWGDAALQYFATRIAAAAGPEGFAARIDGDEFAVLLPAGSSGEFADAALAMLEQPVDISGRRAVLSASIGVAALDANAGVQGAIRRAGLALSEAKAAGGRCKRHYLPGTEARIAATEALEHELQIALERGEFRSYYQPQVSLGSMAIVGAESLIRWQHPGRGLVAPGEFIPLLEKGHLIVAVGAWILRQACQDAMTWPGHVHISVNVAVTQLLSGDFVGIVADILAGTGLDPARLDLELTESLFIQDANFVAKVLQDLRALGVGLSLDDFGTGYSSLAYIKRYPFTKVKLDRAFVRDLPESRESVAITQAVTAIASALDLKVVAEGVETPEQLSAVRLLGCDEVQGFFTGRPMPAAAFAQCLADAGASVCAKESPEDLRHQNMSAP